MTLTVFDGLAEPLRLALAAEKHFMPTPIQAQAIPIVAEGRDLLGIAETGSGKTAAFALPILQRLSTEHSRPFPGAPRVLVLAPTRELAGQIGERFRAYGRKLSLRTCVLFGGVSQFHQVKALKAGADILIATPGRLLDLCAQRHLRLDRVSILVLDEADRMLDMGFIHDVRKIVSQCRRERQTLLFSATMPPAIAKLAQDILGNPVRVDVAPPKVVVERIRQRVFSVSTQGKQALLERLLDDPAMDRVLVFSRTKRGADRVCRNLVQAGIAAAALHGNKAQNVRVRALESFRDSRIRVLVATDIAARGIDVRNISHVINYDLPNEPESYVHRIGRTARAGAGGTALSFCDPGETPYLRAIERLTGSSLTIERDPSAGLPARAAIRQPKTQGKSSAATARGRQSRSHGGGFPGLPRGLPKSRQASRAMPA
jgi:ATP-dependent RNA helicase RhlE